MDRPKIVKYEKPSRIEDYPCGAFQAGHLVMSNAGWRVFRPVIEQDMCVKCLRCFLVCPDGAIDKSEEQLEIDYNFCKGCGVCAAECPAGAIKMVREGDEADGDK